MGYNPVPPPPVITAQRISERERETLKNQYVRGEIEIEQFEESIGKWMVWETLNPLARREFELQNEGFVVPFDTGKIGTRRGPG